MELISSALIFPDTEPSGHGMARLLVFFNALSYYLPTEIAGEDKKDNNFFTNLSTGYVPAPLGEDLSRFNRLLREMETSRSDELARLFSAAKAPVAAGQLRDQDEISASSVYAAMKGDADTKRSRRYKERLWQARLILKLAETLARREAEVSLGLAQISSVEQKVFTALEGLGEAEKDDPAEMGSLDTFRHFDGENIMPEETSPGTSAALIPLRLKAWAELYLADTSDRHPMALATTSPASGAILLDGYENTWRRDPKKLFSLSIPALYLAGKKGAREQYQASRNTFRAAAQENLEYLASLLQKTSSTAEPVHHSQKELSDNVSAWKQKIKTHFPGHKTGFRKLDFYCFPGLPFSELLQRLLHLEEPVSAKIQEHPTGLLAILNP